MGPVTIVFGFLFIALGLVGYVPTQALLALVPLGLGVLLVVLGMLARQDRLRKHVMHFAAMLGLIGAAVEIVLLVLAFQHEEGPYRSTAYVTAQLLTAIGCGVFEWLCVKSFIAARRARRQHEAERV